MALAAHHNKPTTPHSTPLVWVTRPQPNAEEHANSLRRTGISAIICPVLRILACPLPRWNAALPDAVLVSSVNGLAYLPQDWCEALQKTPLITSGSATGAKAKETGFSKIENSPGFGSRGIVDLVLSLAEEQPQVKSLLYLAGTIRNPYLENKLAGAFDLRVAEIYEAQTVHKPSDELSAALQNDKISAITLFSSRSAALAAAMLHDLGPGGLRNLEELQVICISHAVADAAKEAGFVKVVESDDETEKSVTKKLVNQLNIKNK